MRCQTHQVINDISEERERQQSEEGWTHSHDDGHSEGEIAEAAACYAVGRKLLYGPPHGAIYNMCEPNYDTHPKHSRRRQLVIAAALLVAEIERIDRLGIR